MITDKEKQFLIHRVLGAATSRCYLKKTVLKIYYQKVKDIWSYATLFLVVLSVAHSKP